MIELKPCPFCSDGGHPYINKECFQRIWVNENECEDWVMQFSYQVKCMECMTAGPSWFKTEEEAIESWNTRHEPTCTMEFQDNGYSKWWECSNCQDTEWYPSLRRCPTCGARVVDGDV